jgi:hypothetical protein
MFASYELSLLMAKTGKQHTVAEDLTASAARAITSRMMEDRSKNYDLM